MFKAWPKIPRLENEVFHITEKIDGTNACISIHTYDPAAQKPLYIDPTYTYAVYAQSRKHIIYPANDNYGFAQWVLDNAQDLITDLGCGYHFGEWWGQGIQRGYGLNHKRFSLFNPNKHSSLCHGVPLLASCNAHMLSEHIDTCKLDLERLGSSAAPGFMNPEGLVIYAEQSKSYWKVIIDK